MRDRLPNQCLERRRRPRTPQRRQDHEPPERNFQPGRHRNQQRAQYRDHLRRHSGAQMIQHAPPRRPIARGQEPFRARGHTKDRPPPRGLRAEPHPPLRTGEQSGLHRARARLRSPPPPPSPLRRRSRRTCGPRRRRHQRNPSRVRARLLRPARRSRVAARGRSAAPRRRVAGRLGPAPPGRERTSPRRGPLRAGVRRRCPQPPRARPAAWAPPGARPRARRRRRPRATPPAIPPPPPHRASLGLRRRHPARPRTAAARQTNPSPTAPPTRADPRRFLARGARASARRPGRHRATPVMPVPIRRVPRNCDVRHGSEGGPRRYVADVRRSLVLGRRLGPQGRATARRFPSGRAWLVAAVQRRDRLRRIDAICSGIQSRPRKAILCAVQTAVCAHNSGCLPRRRTVSSRLSSTSRYPFRRVTPVSVGNPRAHVSPYPPGYIAAGHDSSGRSRPAMAASPGERIRRGHPCPVGTRRYRDRVALCALSPAAAARNHGRLPAPRAGLVAASLLGVALRRMRSVLTRAPRRCRGQRRALRARPRRRRARPPARAHAPESASPRRPCSRWPFVGSIRSCRHPAFTSRAAPVRRRRRARPRALPGRQVRLVAALSARGCLFVGSIPSLPASGAIAAPSRTRSDRSPPRRASAGSHCTGPAQVRTSLRRGPRHRRGTSPRPTLASVACALPARAPCRRPQTSAASARRHETTARNLVGGVAGRCRWRLGVPPPAGHRGAPLLRRARFSRGPAPEAAGPVARTAPVAGNPAAFSIRRGAFRRRHGLEPQAGIGSICAPRPPPFRQVRLCVPGLALFPRPRHSLGDLSGERPLAAGDQIRQQIAKLTLPGSRENRCERRPPDSLGNSPVRLRRARTPSPISASPNDASPPHQARERPMRYRAGRLRTGRPPASLLSQAPEVRRSRCPAPRALRAFRRRRPSLGAAPVRWSNSPRSGRFGMDWTLRTFPVPAGNPALPSGSPRASVPYPDAHRRQPRAEGPPAAIPVRVRSTPSRRNPRVVAPPGGGVAEPTSPASTGGTGGVVRVCAESRREALLRPALSAGRRYPQRATWPTRRARHCRPTGPMRGSPPGRRHGPGLGREALDPPAHAGRVPRRRRAARSAASGAPEAACAGSRTGAPRSGESPPERGGHTRLGRDQMPQPGNEVRCAGAGEDSAERSRAGARRAAGSRRPRHARTRRRIDTGIGPGRRSIR